MTKNDYFNNCKTVNEIKARYHELCFQYHPDLQARENFSYYNAILAEINMQYTNMLKGANKQTNFGDDGKEHTYYYNEDIELAVADMLRKTIALGMVNVKIMLIGSWLWIGGETKPYSKVLGKNGLGLRWNNKRKMWYFAPKTPRRRRSSGKSTEELKRIYGVNEYRSETRPAVK